MLVRLLRFALHSNEHQLRQARQAPRNSAVCCNAVRYPQQRYEPHHFPAHNAAQPMIRNSKHIADRVLQLRILRPRCASCSKLSRPPARSSVSGGLWRSFCREQTRLPVFLMEWLNLCAVTCRRRNLKQEFLLFSLSLVVAAHFSTRYTLRATMSSWPSR